MIVPEFLSVGFITRDFIRDREQPGGSCFYTAKTAAKLGKKSAIFTSATQEFVDQLNTPSLEIRISPSQVTTTFTHTYDSDGHRTQKCTEIAPPLEAKSMPESFRKSQMVAICPNGHEVSPESVEWFEPKWTAVMPQGWFRKFHPDGQVSFVSGLWKRLPRCVDLLVVSEEDVAHDKEAWNWMRRDAKVAVMTKGKKGHLVWAHNQEVDLQPPHISVEIDPTGAGDVFGAAMLIALSEGADAIEAARFGSAAASYAVEKPGSDGIPSREEIQARL